jgi:hypothetical protein
MPRRKVLSPRFAMADTPDYPTPIAPCSSIRGTPLVIVADHPGQRMAQCPDELRYPRLPPRRPAQVEASEVLHVTLATSS